MALRVLTLFVVGAVVLHPAVMAVRTASLGLEEEEGDLTTELKYQVDLNISAEHRAKAQVFCSDNVVIFGCEYLNGATDGLVVSLANGIAVKEEQVGRLLEALGLTPSSSCKELCERAVGMIPTILGRGIPAQPHAACTDLACDDAIDVSDAALRNTGMSFDHVPTSQDSVVETDSPRPAEKNEVSLKQMERRVVNVVFLAFPQLDDESDEMAPAELAPGQSLLESDADPTFGDRVRPDRYNDYKRFTAQAHANVVSAIRKLPFADNYLKKWFGLSALGDVEEMRKEARWHLTSVLDALSELKIKKDGEHCKDYVLAYVMAVGTCTLEDWSICSSLENGRYVTTICEWYWQFEDATKIGTLVHEASHHFGTKDKAYCSGGGQDTCLSLTTALAKENADSFSYFVKDVVADSNLGETGTPEAPPCVDAKSTGFVDMGGQPISCDSAASFGLTCSRGSVAQLCRVTCGTCPSTTLAPTPSTTLAPTPSTATTSSTTSPSTTIPSTTTTPSTPTSCTDSSNYCHLYESYCEYGFAKTACPSICEPDCRSGEAATTATTTSTTTTTTTTTTMPTTPAPTSPSMPTSCTDSSNYCHMYESYCEYAFAKRTCPSICKPECR
jgi:hypothetical protein